MIVPDAARMQGIPFNRSSMVGREEEYISDALESGQIAGDQVFGRKCEALLQEALPGSRRVLMTTSCTHALELAAYLLGMGPGDEVVIPSFTFVSTANAFAVRGATPVFCDSLPDTLNADPDDVERKIGPRTKGIVLVHYAGVACRMERFLDLAERTGLPLIEDNAHGLFGTWRGTPLGTLGTLATQSFHETKNFTCGEGGALVINDPRFVQRAEILREKGTDRSRFFRGQVDKYTWVDLGSSYVMSDVLAAFLLGQLERREEVQRRRRSIWENYDRELAAWADAHGIRRPIVPPDAGQAWHLYYLLLPSLEDRQRFIAHMTGRGIMTVFHYQPLHLSAMGLQLGGRRGACPVAEDASHRLVRLPMFYSLSGEMQERIVAAVRAFTPGT